MRSVTVYLDFFLACNSLLDQEFENVASMVSLKLNDGTPSGIFIGGSVAAPGFLEVSGHFLQVQILRQPLNHSQALSRVSLLEMQVCQNQTNHVRNSLRICTCIYIIEQFWRV